jgi:hypothetical protein
MTELTINILLDTNNQNYQKLLENIKNIETDLKSIPQNTFNLPNGEKLQDVKVEDISISIKRKRKKR